jgi:hypothetical protein
MELERRPLVPDEPGDPADHRAEVMLYWPHVGAEAWALGLDVAQGGELEDELAQQQHDEHRRGGHEHHGG